MPLLRSPVASFNRRSFADQVLIDCPTHFYRFDEASGPVAVDRSGNGNHGTYTNFGAPANPLIAGSGNAGRRGAIVSFTHPFTESYRDFTLELVCSLSAPAANRIVSLGSGNGVSLLISGPQNDNVLGLYLIAVAESRHWIASGMPAAECQIGRNQIAYTFDSYDSTVFLFLNGRYLWRFYVSMLPPSPTGTIGSAALPDVVFDEFALYDSCLPRSRLTAHYRAMQLGV